ncbi:MAG: PQQ-binding-like beta-propeller repeat protein [Victivallales bacterium]|nr:PQQ-binding-like beta-propeller repeat protein [Victivallales bacterium]
MQYFFPRLVSVALVCMFAALPVFAQKGGDWPKWRGPNGDGIGLDKGLLKEWPAEGPKVAWQIDSVGEGYSSVAVLGDRIYTQGNVDGIEKILALNAADGSVIWAVQPEPVKNAVDASIKSRMERGDRNGDGRLEEAEALPSLGWAINKADKPVEGAADQIAAERTKRLLAGLDKDGDGVLSAGEAMGAFQREFSKVDQQDPDADVAALAKRRADALMQAHDRDDDGQLARDEYRPTWLQQAARRIDQRAQGARRGDGKLTPTEISDYLEKYQPGRDGKLTAQELRTFYAKTFPKRDGIYTEDELRAVLGGYRHSAGNGPRGMPTLHEGRLYVQGGKGDVSCLDVATGKTYWHVSLTQDLGGRVPAWGYSESPLVHENMVIVTPGGVKGTVAALNKDTGELLWQSDEVTDPADYSSAVATEIGGIQQVVQFAKGGVFGLTPDKGRLMWTYRHQKARSSINITTPIVFNDHVMVSSAYSNGTGLAKIATAGAEQSAKEVYFEKRLDNHHGGIVKVGDYVYGFGGRGLICMHFLTGEIAWQDRSVRKGSLIVADGMLYLLGERHEVALAEATHEEYRERGRFKIKNLGKPSWAHPVVARGRLYIRNQHSLTAYDVKGP